MLWLEAPRELLQITDGTTPPTHEQSIELANPAVWVRTLAKKQKQAEDDLRELVAICGNTVDHTDQRIHRIENAYQALTEGTRYVYDRLNANQGIEEAWVRSELAAAANAYQTFTRNVWQAIIEKTDEAMERQVCQAIQLARVNDALSFLGEANMARNQHLATFQGNVELWAADHQQKVAELQQELQRTRSEVQRLATRIPLPPMTPSPPPPSLPPTDPVGQTWRSPTRLPSTRAPEQNSRRSSKSSAGQPDTQPTGRTYPPLRSPIELSFPAPTRRIRPPAIPPTPRPISPTPSLAADQALLAALRRTNPAPPVERPGLGGAGGPPSGRPPRPPVRSPTPPLPPSPRNTQRAPTPPGNPQPTLTTQDLIQLVAQGVARANREEETRPNRVRTSRLKLENPEMFDGKPTTPFNNWWKTVTKYLSFYPETSDQQKIVWVGTLLTGTAKSWDLHRYEMLGENDSWVNYAAAIRAEYYDSREATNAQLKLGQLKYTGDIRAYMTEFRALNNHASTTGESLQEKIDLALPEAVIDMCFAHYLGEFADDEGFLQATYQAALQVERKKALKQAKEQMKGQAGTPGGKTEKKEDRRMEARTTPRPKETGPRGNLPNTKNP